MNALRFGDFRDDGAQAPRHTVQLPAIDSIDFEGLASCTGREIGHLRSATQALDNLFVSHGRTIGIFFRVVKAPYSDDLTHCSDNNSDMTKKTDPLREEVGRRLARLRLALEYEKQRHFAKDIKVPEETYTKWEKGRALIPAHYVHALKLRWGITADWLYFGDESALSPPMAEKLRKVA